MFIDYCEAIVWLVTLGRYEIDLSGRAKLAKMKTKYAKVLTENRLLEHGMNSSRLDTVRVIEAHWNFPTSTEGVDHHTRNKYYEFIQKHYTWCDECQGEGGKRNPDHDFDDGEEEFENPDNGLDHWCQECHGIGRKLARSMWGRYPGLVEKLLG